MDHIWFVRPPPASVLHQHPAGSAVALQDSTDHLSIPKGMQPKLPVSCYEKAFWPVLSAEVTEGTVSESLLSVTMKFVLYWGVKTQTHGPHPAFPATISVTSIRRRSGTEIS